MLEIKNSEPWIFWPSSICDTFPINPANKKLNGEHSFLIDLDFTLLDDNKEKKTIFSLLPMYSGYDVDSGCDVFLYNDGEKTHTRVLPNLVKPNLKTNIKFQYIYKDRIELYIDNIKQCSIELKDKKLGYSESPHIIFGAGNFPKNNFNLNYTNINLHEFKLIVDDELVSHHTFDTFIHDKSFDKTNNLNFIHKL